MSIMHVLIVYGISDLVSQNIYIKGLNLCIYKSKSQKQLFVKISHIKHDFRTISDFYFSNYKLLRTLLAENMLGKVKWTTVIFVLCNISAMCTEMTKTNDIMIGLRQLLCMCKAEKTQLNDKIAIGGFCVQRTVADKVQKIGT